jgi:NAD(P)-dependent dehydrogenase (short-subunit alcohol dehydrogenase family)
MSLKAPLTILLTGGARGIGRGLTRHFLTSGHRVCIIDSNKEELAHTADLAEHWRDPEIRLAFESLLVDLRDRKAIAKCFRIIEVWCRGRLDVLINNAMPTPHVWAEGKKMEDDSENIMEEWDDKIAVGLTAPFLLSRLCVPLLKSDSASRQPGCIINISSTRAYQSEMDHEAYSAVKAGILGLTQSMSVSLGHRHKIRVNAIIPGWIHVQNEAEATENQSWEDGLTRDDAEWHPAGRVGKVEDIAKAAEFLIQSDFVTGQEIVVDGGVSRKMVYPE